MRNRFGVHGRVTLAIIGIVLALGPFQGMSALSPQPERGREIYQKGASPRGGEITAVVGTEGVVLPASTVPCAGCHGSDGLGRPEGGVLPPNIRWSELTRSYDHVHPDGRRHPAFDETSLARLLRIGVDPAGNRLDRSMPLYVMSDEDMSDLLAYLRQFEYDRDPGVEKDRIQIASLLPLQGPQAGLGQAMGQVMQAYFQEINEQGGVFGRRIDLLAIPYGESPEATLDTLRLAFRRERIFALVGAYTVGLDQEILDLLRDEGAPLVGPFTLDPGDEIVNAAVFYLYPGFVEQVLALADQALAAGNGGPANSLLIAGPEGARVDRLAAAVQAQMRKRQAKPPLAVRYPRGELDIEGLARRVQGSNTDAVLFLGEQSELEPLLGALARRESYPRIYLLSSFVSRLPLEAPPGFNQRIYIAYPTLASDVSASGFAEYQRLARAVALPSDHLQGQIAAYAAAKLLVTGLRGAGRALDRRRLVDALEALYAYDTGLTPPLTYGPNRRIGARGAYIVAVDLVKNTYEPVGGWHEAP
jgi:ABC-type branched-subunit amino acid transport system substrate-binding protein